MLSSDVAAKRTWRAVVGLAGCAACGEPPGLHISWKLLTGTQSVECDDLEPSTEVRHAVRAQVNNGSDPVYECGAGEAIFEPDTSGLNGSQQEYEISVELWTEDDFRIDLAYDTTVIHAT